MVPFFSVIYEETERNTERKPNGLHTRVMLCVTIPTKISIRLDIRRGVVASDFCIQKIMKGVK